MRKLSSLLALVVGGLSIAGLQSHADAAVGIYYVNSGVDSMWGSQTFPEDFVAYPGATRTTTYGLMGGGSYLPGTFVFNKSTQNSAPGGTGFQLGTGVAYGRGQQDTSLSDAGFSISGSGYGEVQYDTTPLTGTEGDRIYGNGSSSFTTNFTALPGNDTHLFLTGTASCDAYAILMVRLADHAPGGAVTTLIDVNQDGTQPGSFSQSWSNQDFTLGAGHWFELVAYSSPNFPYADATVPDFFTATSQFNLTGTFVPEPAILSTLLLGGAVAMLRRRREVSVLK